MYVVESYIRKNNLHFDDGTSKMILNTKCSPDKVPEKLRAFYKYINDPTEIDSKLVEDIDKRVRKYNTPEWRERQLTFGHMLDEAEKKGLEVVAAKAFTADNKTDFSVQIQKAKDAGAELVFLPIYYQEASLILAQANKAGFSPKWFGCDGMDGILDLEGFDASLAENLMFLTPFTANATDDATQKFVADFKDAFGDTPIQFAADAYDCVYAIKAAAEKENITPDMSASDICDALKKGMTEITYDGLTGKSITWSEDGEPTKDPTVVVVQNGEYQVLEAK